MCSQARALLHVCKGGFSRKEENESFTGRRSRVQDLGVSSVFSHEGVFGPQADTWYFKVAQSRLTPATAEAQAVRAAQVEAGRQVTVSWETPLRLGAGIPPSPLTASACAPGAPCSVFRLGDRAWLQGLVLSGGLGGLGRVACSTRALTRGRSSIGVERLVTLNSAALDRALCSA